MITCMAPELAQRYYGAPLPHLASVSAIEPEPRANQRLKLASLSH